MSNEEGQTLLAGLFGSSIKADGHELLSQIRSQMRVSSLGRHDVELVEKSQSLFAPSNQYSLLEILRLALYRLSNNLLLEDVTDEFLKLIEQEQDELLVSFLQSRMPSVHACGTKILEHALRIGDADFLELLITSGIDISPLRGVCGGRHLVHTASESNIQVAQILLKYGADVDILTSQEHPYTALQYAALKGQPQMLQVLLKAGANIDALTADSAYNTALSIAVCNHEIELVRILVTAGANLDICTVAESSAIEYSALYCDDKLHQTLLSRSGKDHISTTSHGTWKAAKRGIQALAKYLAKSGDELKYPVMKVLNYALELAAHEEDDEAILSLLAIGADPNAIVIIHKGRFTSPLLTAVENCDMEIVEILLQAGGDVNNTNILSAAARSQEPIGMLQLMLEVGANIETSGGKALEIAVTSENIEAVQFLLSYGANVNHSNSRFPTPLQRAIIRQNIELVKILLDAGSDVNTSSYKQILGISVGGRTVLQSAVEERDRSGLRLEIVQILLAAGADVNAPKNGGPSILQSAICTGDEELVEILLKEGADVNNLPQGKEGRSPIQAAAERGSIPLVKLLLQSGADVNDSPGRDHGRTAIQAASSATNPTMELIDFLIDSGADIHAPAGLCGGVTALQGAAIRGHIRIALKFLEAGADVNAAGAILYGQTALDGAAEHGRLDMVQMLLNAGACGDSTKAQRFGMAMKLARMNSHFAVAKLLEQP